MLTGLVVAFAKELAAAITRGRSNPNEKAHRACDRSRTDCFRWCMGLCLLRGDVKHDARCGLASSICGYSRIAVDHLEWFQTLGRLLCYVDFSLCANRNRIPNDPLASKDRRQGTPLRTKASAIRRRSGSSSPWPENELMTRLAVDSRCAG